MFTSEFCSNPAYNNLELRFSVPLNRNKYINYRFQLLRIKACGKFIQKTVEYPLIITKSSEIKNEFQCPRLLKDESQIK